MSSEPLPLVSQLDALETAYPWIKWREPVQMSSAGQHGYDCRICLAKRGKKGHEPPQFHSHRDALYHLQVAHGA